MRPLKRDLFGTVTLEQRAGTWMVTRDTRGARAWLRWLARRLARREARALLRLEGAAGVPRLLGADRDVLVRSWIPGQPMQLAQPREPEYFARALRLVRQLHARDLAHNDLAKETNWLVSPDHTPALVDFQLAVHAPRRGRLFRALAYDDLRHLLKHKRTYTPAALTARERRILSRPSLAARLWRASGKPLYLFVTRRIFGWADREGAGDRRLDA